MTPRRAPLFPSFDTKRAARSRPLFGAMLRPHAAPATSRRVRRTAGADLHRVPPVATQFLERVLGSSHAACRQAFGLAGPHVRSIAPRRAPSKLHSAAAFPARRKASLRASMAA